MAPGVVVAMLTLLLSIQPITTDLYLPALHTLQRELGACPLTLGVGGFSVLLFIVANTLVQRHDEPAPRALATSAGGSAG